MSNSGSSFITYGIKFPFQILVSCFFLHTFQRENTYAKLHENAPFEMKNYKNFLGRGHCPLPTGEGDPPSPESTPLGASTLVPSMGNCHGCPQILETPLKLTGDTNTGCTSVNFCLETKNELQGYVQWAVSLVLSRKEECKGNEKINSKPVDITKNNKQQNLIK